MILYVKILAHHSEGCECELSFVTRFHSRFGLQPMAMAGTVGTDDEATMRAAALALGIFTHLTNHPYDLEPWENARNVCFSIVRIIGDYHPLVDFWVAITRGKTMWRSGCTLLDTETISEKSMGVYDLTMKDTKELSSMMVNNPSYANILYSEIGLAVEFLMNLSQSAENCAVPHELESIAFEAAAVMAEVGDFMKKSQSSRAM